MKRICNMCGENKPLTEYRKDSKGRDGYAVRCKVCKDARKMGFTPTKVMDKAMMKKNHEKMHETLDKTFTIKPMSVNECRFKQLSQKYKSFCGLSIDKDGNARLQIFANPVLTFKSDSVDDVLDRALRYASHV